MVKCMLGSFPMISGTASENILEMTRFSAAIGIKVFGETLDSSKRRVLTAFWPYSKGDMNTSILLCFK